jgi:hypothetical protein
MPLESKTNRARVDRRQRKGPRRHDSVAFDEIAEVKLSLLAQLPITHRGVVIAYISVNYLIQDLMLAQQALALLTKTEPHGRVFE